MNPFGALFTMGLTKLTFTQKIMVQNSKNPETKLIVHKYLCLQVI
jgi:hypothetical protein